jgi:hypothetical protein
MKDIFFTSNDLLDKQQIISQIRDRMAKARGDSLNFRVYIDGISHGVINSDTNLEEYAISIKSVIADNYLRKKTVIPQFSLANQFYLNEQKWSPYTKARIPLYPRFSFSHGEHFSVLTEGNARATINQYSDGCYIIFRKKETFHLIAKLNSEIQQFDILTKDCNLLFSGIYNEPSFNLKDDKGNLLFKGKGVSATNLQGFLSSSEIKQFFPFQPMLGRVKVLSNFGGFSQSEEDSLQIQSIKHLVINDPGLSWLPGLPERIQNQALFYFLDTFISNLTTPSAIELLLSEGSWQPSYRKHYSIKQIEQNLNTLHVLYIKGNTTAAMLLASIFYSGLCEDQENRVCAEVMFFNTPQKKEVLFRDLEKYREITQNPIHFPNKVVSDLCLLKFFEAKNDKEGASAQLIQIDVSQAIWLDTKLCSDCKIKSCIEANKRDSLEKLVAVKNVLHELIILDRLILADWIKDKLPKEVSKEVLTAKDETGRNILHVLVNYLSENGLSGSALVIKLFNFVSQRFPDMLSEQDSEGNTVYNYIDRLALHSSEDIYKEIEASIASYRDQAKGIYKPA